MSTKPASAEHEAGSASLSARDKVIAALLQQASRPLSAYDLVGLLRDQGTIAPTTTVYRSLNRLIAAGLAHRLESVNAFVSCTHACKHGPAMFAICDACGTVTEFENAVVASRLMTWAQTVKFAVARTTVELRGHCKDCHSAAGAASA